MRVLIINGPNLNMLGKREPGIYGNTTYEELCDDLKAYAQRKNIELDLFQSNIEGEIVGCIQNAFSNNIDGIVINPGAYSHYSYAIRDALVMIKAPIVEVHISNIHTREEFRHTSVTAPVCSGQITGLGLSGYFLALDYIKNETKENK